MPAAYFLSEALRAAKSPASGLVQLQPFAIAAPLLYSRDTAVEVTVEKTKISCSHQGTLHAKGKVKSIENMPVLNLALHPSTPIRWMGSAEIYRLMRKRGAEYGIAFRRLVQRVGVTDDIAVGLLKRHPQFLEEKGIHPTILDSAFHVLVAFAGDEQLASPSGRVAVPAYFGTVTWDSGVEAVDGKYRVAVRIIKDESKKNQVAYDLEITNTAGQRLLVIEHGIMESIELEALVAKP